MKLETIKNKIESNLSDYKLPETISIDINFNINESIADELYELIIERFNLISEENREEIGLEFELDAVKILFYMNKYDNCIKYLDKLNELFPNNSLILYNLGYIHSIINNPQRAMDYYMDVIELEPDNAQIYNEIGLLARRMDNLELAIRFLKTAIEKDQKHAESWRNLGIVYMEIKEFDKAIKCLKKALEINSKYITAMNFLALCYHFKGEHDKAIRKLEKALNINEKFSMGWKNLASIYFNIENYQQAIECYEKLLELDDIKESETKRINTMIEIAAIYINKLNEVEKANKILKEAKEINNKNGEIWYHLGLIQYKKGNKLAAEKNFNKAIELDPDIMMKIPDLFL
ncbi:MAG: tetratricopeptide repeat protein [Candidatus Lokiarchaeota archaeon]|nr:tetratricopeptide repeat protein [Candidatus Lokiarchaeota archaeon]